MSDALSVSDRLSSVHSRIAAAAKAAGRLGDAIALTAVSKQQPDDRVDAALAAGYRRFGENRVQEAQARWGERRRGYADLELRLIGPLQSNKAAAAAALFDVIETVDRASLVKALPAAMEKAGRAPSLLVQVNTGQEPQKSGVAPGGLSALLDLCGEAGLKIDGLMCIPPAGEPAGPHFALLAKLAAAHGLSVLSMGMSGDFETAIRFGATHVRVGSEVFGARPQTKP
ncbi:MAG: YggS family pyridoxal phosphate-dependent enzyme [Pseudomonadota bacterium]